MLVLLCIHKHILVHTHLKLIKIILSQTIITIIIMTKLLSPLPLLLCVYVYVWCK